MALFKQCFSGDESDYNKLKNRISNFRSELSGLGSKRLTNSEVTRFLERYKRLNSLVTDKKLPVHRAEKLQRKLEEVKECFRKLGIMEANVESYSELQNSNTNLKQTIDTENRTQSTKYGAITTECNSQQHSGNDRPPRPKSRTVDNLPKVHSGPNGEDKATPYKNPAKDVITTNESSKFKSKRLQEQEGNKREKQTGSTSYRGYKSQIDEKTDTKEDSNSKTSVQVIQVYSRSCSPSLADQNISALKAIEQSLTKSTKREVTSKRNFSPDHEEIREQNLLTYQSLDSNDEGKRQFRKTVAEKLAESLAKLQEQYANVHQQENINLYLSDSSINSKVDEFSQYSTRHPSELIDLKERKRESVTDFSEKQEFMDTKTNQLENPVTSYLTAQEKSTQHSFDNAVQNNYPHSQIRKKYREESVAEPKYGKNTGSTQKIGCPQTSSDQYVSQRNTESSNPEIYSDSDIKMGKRIDEVYKNMQNDFAAFQSDPSTKEHYSGLYPESTVPDKNTTDSRNRQDHVAFQNYGNMGTHYHGIYPGSTVPSSNTTDSRNRRDSQYESDTEMKTTIDPNPCKIDIETQTNDNFSQGQLEKNRLWKNMDLEGTIYKDRRTSSIEHSSNQGDYVVEDPEGARYKEHRTSSAKYISNQRDYVVEDSNKNKKNLGNQNNISRGRARSTTSNDYSQAQQQHGTSSRDSMNSQRHTFLQQTISSKENFPYNQTNTNYRNFSLKNENSTSHNKNESNSRSRDHGRTGSSENQYNYGRSQQQNYHQQRDQDYYQNNQFLESVEVAEEAEEQPSLQILDVHQYFRDDFDINSIDKLDEDMSKIKVLEATAQSYQDKVSQFSEEKYSLEYFVLDEKLMRLIEKLDKIKCQDDQEATYAKISVIEYIKNLHKMLDERAKEE